MNSLQEKLGETLEILALAVDCERFTIDGQAYRVSRTALIRHSGFFENLLRNRCNVRDPSNREDLELTLPEGTKPVFEHLLQFLGTGALDVRMVTEQNFIHMVCHQRPAHVCDDHCKARAFQISVFFLEE